MKNFQTVCNLSVIAFFLILGIANIPAQDIQVKTTEDPFFLKNSDKTENKTIEPSAVEPIGDGRFLLIADDETDKKTNTNLAVFEVAAGIVVNRISLPCMPDNDNPCIPKNPKWEAMAKDDEGYFYVIGSHAVKSDDTDTGKKLEEKFLSRSHLYRFRLKDENIDGKDIRIDEKSVAEINIRDFFKESGLYKPDTPKNSQLKIEGLAIRKSGNIKELVVGLREPSDFVRVYSGQLPNMPTNGAGVSLKPLFKFDAGKVKNMPFQLSSIEYVPSWRGFLVLTSTEDKATNAFFGNRLWFVSDEAIMSAQPANSSDSKPLAIQNIWEFASETEGKKAMKAEGLSVLGECNIAAGKKMIRAAIVFDNDSEKTGVSGAIQYIEISNSVK